MRRIHISPCSVLKNSPILICGLLRPILVATFGSQTLILFIFSEGQSSFIFCADSLSLCLLPLPDSQSRVRGSLYTFVILFCYFATFIDIALTQLLYFPCFTLSSVDLRTPHCQHYLATQIAPFRKERIKNLTMSQKQALTARHYYRKAHHCR